MNELDQIYEWDEEEENPRVVEIDTAHGPVPIPVDENWHEYTEDEREFIKNVVGEISEWDCVDTREHLIDEEHSSRCMTELFSFDEAKKASDGTVVMIGDWGGQIYLTCPMKYVKCNEELINNLLREINDTEWGCVEIDGIKYDGSRIDYLRAESGDFINEGMGGGFVEDELWIHPGICPKKAELIRKVINGESTSIFN